MDRERFDALTRLLATPGSRRTALGALLGTALLGSRAEVLAKPGKRRDRGKDRDNDKNTDKAKKRKQQQRTKRARAEAAAGCCSGGNCTPGPGKNLARCCYQGQTLTGKSFKGANLGSTNFSGATLTNANFSGANLDKTCLVDADLTGARLAGANTGTAIFCRTTMPDGTENNSGCNKGTACCPTCTSDTQCEDGERCCEGRCQAVECCGDGVRSNCEDGQVCCDNQCVEGECCGQGVRGNCDAGEVCCDGLCESGDACCEALREPCTSVDQCCAAEDVACAQNNAVVDQTVCCSTLGGPCSGLGLGMDCCAVSVPGGTDNSFCSAETNGTCGGEGAACRFNEACDSGACCGAVGGGFGTCVNPCTPSQPCCPGGTHCTPCGCCPNGQNCSPSGCCTFVRDACDPTTNTCCAAPRNFCKTVGEQSFCCGVSGVSPCNPGTADRCCSGVCGSDLTCA